MKREPELDRDDEGVVAWLKSDDDDEPGQARGPSVAIDVATMLGFLQAGVSITTDRARTLAADLIALADYVDGGGK